MTRTNFSKYRNIIKNSDPYTRFGIVNKISGLSVEATGLTACLGEVCRIFSINGGDSILAEVVGFREKKILLMSLGDLRGIGPGSRVVSTNGPLKVNIGENIKGRVLDGLGRPIDGKGPIEKGEFVGVEASPPSPLQRKRIKEILPLGIKAIDGLLTCGVGQRIGIFAGSGVGKSTLLGMIARNARSDINVITLVGERGREVNDFIEKDLKEEGLKKSVLIVATSDQPALVRLKSAMLGTAVAEYFRDKGMRVLMLMDSVTRFAMAQREIGMSVGEPPVSRGYTPSVFSLLPKILERTGNSDVGSITALYTVLVEGDDLNEPIADTVRGILDGHIVLSRELANRNHYPAIDVLASVSRLMPDIVEREHFTKAGEIKNKMAVYRDAEDLINIGAYKKGSNPEIDEAMAAIGPINDMLRQGIDEKFDFDEVMELIRGI